MVAATWWGGYLIGDGEMQIGTLTAFQSYLIQILMSVMMATFMFMLFPRRRFRPSGSPRCSNRAECDAACRVERRTVARGEVQIDMASFAYPGAEEPVLSDIEILASPGETTAIIGSTGSGKSTVLNLIPRLFDATSGAVRLDGVDVRDMQPDDVWAAIGLIPQRPYLFTGTVATNLRYGNPNATDAELWDALEVAQGRDFVEALPEDWMPRVARRHELLRWPAPAPGDRPGRGEASKDLLVRRFLFRLGLRHRRCTSGGAASGDS